MDAVLPTPHVARFASDVDASLAGGNEGLARLAPLRAVLRRLARDPAVHHPGLVSECALDSIGALPRLVSSTPTCASGSRGRRTASCP